MRKFLAFDIGGTLIKYGVLTEDGTFIEKFHSPTEAQMGGRSIVEKVKKFGGEIRRKHDLSGICVSTAGQVDSREGVILYASPLIPDYTGTKLKQELEEFFELPVEVENDVNCAGLAESWIGTGKDAKSLFCLTVGTGIGGSYILDNKLHTGHSFSGGEIGYIPIEGGQFEEMASTRVLVRNVAQLKNLPESEITGEEIFELAQQGDEICIQEIERLVYYLSKGIATITYMMNPEMIIIGGGITAQKDYLYPIIMKQLEEDIIPNILKNTKVKIAQNLNNAGMIGALRHFLLQETLKPMKSITTIIQSNQHKLTKRELLIAKYIIANVESVPNKTITELSRQINVSEATITRFCQKLKFGSYNSLRMLAKEASVSNRLYEQSDITSLSEVKQSYTDMIRQFDSLHPVKGIVDLKEKINRCGQIYLYGTNEMSLVVDLLKFKLMKIGIRTDAFINSYQMEMSIPSLTPDTVVIGLSESGYSPEVLKMMETAKKTGCTTIGITSQQDSPLSHASDVRLLIPAAGDGEGSIGEVAVFYLVDILLKELQSSSDDVDHKGII